MAAFFKKVYNKLLGEEIDEEEERDGAEAIIDEETEEEYEEEEAVDDMTEEKTIREPAKAGKSIELKIAKLNTFDAGVMEVADHLISNRPVVLNLEDASKEAAKRIIDFFSGVTYTIHGQMKNIATGIYIATPSNVDVSNDTARVSEAHSEHKSEAAPAKSNTSAYEGF